MTHLWETAHPYYGAEGYSEQVESFADLREQVDHADEDMNHVYRFDWLPAEEGYRETDELTVFCALPRKNSFWSLTCPIQREQEDEVLEWLRGPRILGALRKVWAPLLDEPEAAEG